MRNATKLKEIRLPEVYVLNPWPGIARTIWGDHQSYKDTYFSTFQVNISLETALYVTKLDIIELRAA
jgi:acyl-coenzyme A synthetase/AMP-(fatty) acid ligase